MTILCYHTVEPDWRSPMAVPPDRFAEHCRWLATHREVVPLADLGVDGERDRRVALTFDDGLSGLHEHALPLLRRYRLPATVFVVTRTLLGAGGEVDWVDDPPAWPLRTMTRDQLLDLLDAGVDVQSHSHAHADLTTLDDAACLEDLRLSRQVLADTLGTEIRHVAYPRGRHDDRVRAHAAAAGYEAGYALPEGPEPPGRFAVPRVGVHGHNGLGTLRLKTLSAYASVRHHRAYAGVRPLLQAVRS